MVFALGRKGQILLLKYTLKGWLFIFREDYDSSPLRYSVNEDYFYVTVSADFSDFWRPQTTSASFLIFG